MPLKRKPERTSRSGNSTVQVGTELLSVIAKIGAPSTVGKIASAANMSPSRTYRHLRGLVQANFVEQDVATGRYTLGTEALHVGLAALAGIQPLREALKIMPALTEDTGLASAVSIWGSFGPTLVMSEQGGLTSALKYREGSIQRLLTTATGHVFLTYLPDSVTKPIVDSEFGAWREQNPDGDAIAWRSRCDEIRKMVRKTGLGISPRARDSSRVNLAAPIFDHLGRMCLALSLLGARGDVGQVSQSAAANVLRTAARSLSDKLGAPRSETLKSEPPRVVQPGSNGPKSKPARDPAR